jgi:DNA-binding MarR family transcriptional regulator
LANLISCQGIQVSELAQLTRVRKQTMAEVIEQLERLDYVERRPDPQDGRARLVFLTARGRAVGPVGVAAGRRVEEHWARLSSPETIEVLRGSLQQLIAALRDEDHPGSGA